MIESLRESTLRILPFALLCGFLTGCGGGGTTPPTTHGPILSGTGARIVLTIPPDRLQVHLRRPLYVAPTTLGIGINVGPHPTTFTTAQTQTPQTAFDLSPSSSACTAGAGGSRVCTFSIPAMPGSDDIAITTWDASPVGGNFVGANALSSQVLASQSIAIGTSTTLSLALNAIVSTLTISPLPSQVHVQVAGTGYGQVGSALISYNLYALDADGNIITGQGAPALSLTSPDAQIALSNSGTSTWTARVAGFTPQPLTLTATPPVGSGFAPTVLSIPITAIPELWVTLYNNSFGAGSVQGYALYQSGPYLLPNDQILPRPAEPFGITTDGQGDLFIADNVNASVNGYLVGADGAISNCLCDTVGNTVISGLNAPTGLAFGSFASGSIPGSGLWFAECGGNDFQTRVVTATSTAGTGTLVSTGASPVGLALDSFGYIWVTNIGTRALSAFTSSPSVLAPATYTFTPTAGITPKAVAFDPSDATRIWASFTSATGNSVGALSYPTGSTAPATIGAEALSYSSTLIPNALAFDASHHLWVGTYTGFGTKLTQYTVAHGAAPVPTGTVISASTTRRPMSTRRPAVISLGTRGNQPNGILILP